MTFASPNTRFRVALLAFAGVLGLQALWLLPAEMLRSGPRTLPFNEAAAQRAYDHRSSAFWAARWSSLRGDLWSEAANAYAVLLWNTPEQTANDATSAQRARESAQRALALAPHRASTWLLLAGLASRFGWTDLNPTALLKTSYYTGPSDPTLLPRRLSLSVQSNAFDDPEIAQFIRRDVRMILSQRPELKSALLAAYQAASPDGRKLLEQATGAVDPDFLTALRGQPVSPPARGNESVIPKSPQ